MATCIVLSEELPASGAPSVPLELDIAGAQIIGARDVQEDAFLISHLGDDAAVVIVADGMGGHAAGNIASNMAVQTFNRHVTKCYPGTELPTVLREAVHEANKTIADMIGETPALSGMGCTLVAAVAQDGALSWASVGDSHLYRVRGGTLGKLNADHSYGGFLDRMAALGQAVEPEPGCARNMLMSALTGEEILEIDCPHTGTELMSGDWIIASSDGLNTLDDEGIVTIADGASSARECAERLLAAVTEAKAKRQDNTSVVVVRAQARPAVAPVTPPAPIPVPVAPPPGAEEPAAARHEPEDQPSSRNPSRTRLLVDLLLLVIVGAFAYWWGTDRPEAPKPRSPEAPAAQAPIAPTAPADPEEEPPQPVTFRDPLKIGGQGPEMVWIPEGGFEMGSPRPGADAAEQPPHAVQIGRFAIGRYEISHTEYGRFARDTGHDLPPIHPLDPNVYPVVSVSWHDAEAFIRWLSYQTGHRYRLPTEAEWEYAAGAGATTPNWWGYKVGAEEAYCHGCGDILPRAPGPIGRFKPNPFGLYDSAGNVHEWVQDCYIPTYVGASATGNPREADHCEERVARGGGYSTPARALRTTKRFRFGAINRYDDVGIRVARDP
jgi:formylglycine-generating enzyme required for sulfatase activity/serine/threonine protein phosphatase PrpC